MLSKGDRGPSETERGEQYDYLKLLKITQAEEPPSSLRKRRPQILLIEGDAGSGKTTLITFIHQINLGKIIVQLCAKK